MTGVHALVNGVIRIPFSGARENRRVPELELVLLDRRYAWR
jgi:hypothetical protein